MKKKLNILIIILLLLITSMAIYSKTYAKYASSSVWNYYLESQNFYFESDSLKTEPNNYNDTSWNGEPIKFNLRNNLNNNLITAIDINYEVKCTVIGNENLSCKVNNQNKYNGTLSTYKTCINNKNDGVDTHLFDKTTCELKGYDYLASISKQELSFEVVPNVNDYKFKDVKVLVTATSIYPYKKTISANYNLIKHIEKIGKIDYKYNNYNDYSRLIISNSYNEEKCISISWDEKTKHIDLNSINNSTILSENNNYVNSIKVNILPNKNMTFVFYDLNEKKDDFKIIELTNHK